MTLIDSDKLDKNRMVKKPRMYCFEAVNEDNNLIVGDEKYKDAYRSPKIEKGFLLKGNGLFESRLDGGSH